MSKLASLLVTLIDWFTMKKARHNRTLRDLLQLSKSLEDFFFRYRLLEEGSEFKTVFENMGQIRIDATEMAQLAGTRIRIARYIESSRDIRQLVEEVYNDLEELKRSLFTRTLSDKVLSQRAAKLDMSFENLLAAISEITYK